METLIWLFGRGASMACGLSWTVPLASVSLPRQDRIARIREALRAEMNSAAVDTGPYGRMLDVLRCRTATGWHHRFLTTNWDTLLEREVDTACPIECPPWLESSFVFHLNGTVQDVPDGSRRSCFLLESDPKGTRLAKLESNLAFASMTWSDSFVVVGMSFECAIDNSLLTALGRVPLPVEGSRWIVVNPDESALGTACANIQSSLPHATVIGVRNGFAEWLAAGLPELQELGVLENESSA